MRLDVLENVAWWFRSRKKKIFIFKVGDLVSFIPILLLKQKRCYIFLPNIKVVTG